MTDRQLTVTSFFAGCGGLDLGFLGGFSYLGDEVPRSQFAITKAYEVDPFCELTYKQNIGDHFELADLEKLQPENMAPSDFLIGGFPCQEFSLCGPRKGLNSVRGQLYKTLVNYCRTHQPKMFVAENVANIINMEKGSVLKQIIKDFTSAGYRVNHWLLNAADYGVPQSRNRVFLVGVRQDIPGFPCPPIPKFKSAQRSISWAIDDLLNVIDESVPNQSQYFKANRAKNGHGQGDETSTADKPGYTVRANAKSRVQFHYSLERRLTIRECARLQTFPDSFVFPHSATTNIMQIGNAVPPLLANVVAKSCEQFIIEHIEREEGKKAA